MSKMKVQLHQDGSKLDPEEERELHRVRIMLGDYKWLDVRVREGGVVELYTSGAIELRAIASNRMDLTTRD